MTHIRKLEEWEGKQYLSDRISRLPNSIPPSRFRIDIHNAVECVAQSPQKSVCSRLLQLLLNAARVRSR